MKKIIFIIALCVCILASFLLGFCVGNLFSEGIIDVAANGYNNHKELVGVYEADSWLGDTAVLVLYEDGTSQYPSGGEGNWNVIDDVVVLSVKGLGYDNGKQAITVFFNSDVEETEMETISQQIEALNNVEYAKLFVDEYRGRMYIKLIQDDENKEVYNAIINMDGISSAEYQYREIETVSEYEARIMENGLMLNGKFFEKVSG